MLEKLTAAAISYKPMTDIPFLENWNPTSSFDGTADQVFNALFTFSITVGAILAVFMFIVGGLQMIIAKDNPTSISAGKTRMKNAILGLLMLLSTFIVLTTINPQLTELKFLSTDGSGLNSLQAPPTKEKAVNAGAEQRKENLSNRTKQNTPPRTTNSTSDGRYCYRDSVVNNDNPTCFNSESDCTNATTGTRGEGSCSDWIDNKNARKWTALENEKGIMYCKSDKGKCNGATFYTKEACPGNCLARTQSLTTVVQGGQYKIEGTNEAYISKEACDIQASKKTPPSTCSSN